MNETTSDRLSHYRSMVADHPVTVLAILLSLTQLRDCQDFRVWAGIMGKKETHYVPTQRTCDPV
ncbi:MAG: hypothetical protein ACKO1N_01795, partial [Erythrobacter sp.]